MPTYRFFQTSIYLLEIEADTREDATKIAEEDWQERFGSGTDNYGYTYFDGIVKEEAE